MLPPGKYSISQRHTEGTGAGCDGATSHTLSLDLLHAAQPLPLIARIRPNRQGYPSQDRYGQLIEDLSHDTDTNPV